MKKIFSALVVLCLATSIHAQVRIQVAAKRIITKLDRDCDSGLGGDSEYVFEYKVSDNSPLEYSSYNAVLNVLTNAHHAYVNGNNGPFSYTPATISGGAFVPSNGVFFDKTYDCMSQVPTAFTLKWMAYENDNALNYSITTATVDGQTAIQTVQMQVPAANGSQEFTYSAVSTDDGCAQSYEIVFEIIRSYGSTIPLIIPTMTTDAICAGTNTGVLSAGSVGGFGTISYDWSHNGLGTMNDPNTVNGIGTGTYTLNVKDGKNCTATATKTITAIPDLLPINQLLDSVEQICATTSNVVYAIAPQVNSTYHWSYSGTGVTINGSGEQVSLDFDANATSGTLSVYAQDMCMSTNSHTLDLDVHALPVIEISGAATHCENIESILVATGAEDYTWSTGALGDSLIVTPTDTMQVSVIGVDVFGCSSIADFTVNMVANPTVQLTASTLEICAGAQVDFAALTDSLNTILWNTGDTVSTINQSLVDTTTVSVLVTNEFGCTAQAMETVIVHPAPVAQISATSTTLCAGESVNLSVNVLANESVEWSTGANTASIQLTPQATTTYYATISTPYCSDSDTLQIVVNAKPQVIFALAQSLFCEYNNPAQLTGIPAGGTFTGAGVTGTTFDPSVGGVGVHAITYTFTNEFGCGGQVTKSVQVDACLSVEEQTISSIEVYPNPATTQLTIRAAEPIESVQIIDNSGRVVRTLDPQVSFFEVSVADLDNGSYVLVVKITDGVNQLIRFVKN